MVGPDDELQIRIWGQIDADLRVVVDRSGQIYIPKVGEISVAGIHSAISNSTSRTRFKRCTAISALL